MGSGIRGGEGKDDIFGCLMSARVEVMASNREPGAGEDLISPESNFIPRSSFRYRSTSRLTWSKLGRTKSAARPSSGSSGADVATAAMLVTNGLHTQLRNGGRLRYLHCRCMNGMVVRGCNKLQRN